MFYFTQKSEEVITIKFDLDQIKSYPIIDYAARLGYTPRRIGRYYTLKEHDSVRIDPDANYFWRNSTGAHGSLIDFAMHFENKDKAAAIQSLGEQIAAAEFKPIVQSQPRASPPRAPFKLPTPNRNNDKVYAYLRGRGISKLTINQLIADGLLYESAGSHRCVFVGKDGDGVAKFACERGTKDNWKGDVIGSDKKFLFHLPAKIKDSVSLAVFESAVDVLAHCELQPDWMGHRLSLSGTSSVALNAFLDRHPEIRRVTTCLDYDEAGSQAVGRIMVEMSRRNIKAIDRPPTMGKDYAEMLQIRQQQNIQPPTRRQAGIFI